MKIKFSNLKPDDIVWVCYNKNHDKGQEFIYDIDITKGIIKVNEKHTYKCYCLDYRDDTEYDVTENYIKVQIPDIHWALYQRNYNEFYDERGQMTMASGIWSDGPMIEIFVNKSDALNYAETFMSEQYQRNLDMINKCESDNKEILKSIKKLKML